MRIKLFALAILAAALGGTSLHAQDVYSMGATSCGAAATDPLLCGNFTLLQLGAPLGTANLSVYLTQPKASYITWTGDMASMPQANIGQATCATKQTFTVGTHVLTDACTFLYVHFSGGGVPGDTLYYTGFATFHFAYTYAGSGISAGWKRALTAGSLTLNTY